MFIILLANKLVQKQGKSQSYQSWGIRNELKPACILHAKGTFRSGSKSMIGSALGYEHIFGIFLTWLACLTILSCFVPISIAETSTMHHFMFLSR